MCYALWVVDAHPLGPSTAGAVYECTMVPPGYRLPLSLRTGAHAGVAIRSPCNMSQFVPFPRRNGLPRRCAPRNDRWWTYPCPLNDHFSELSQNTKTRDHSGFTAVGTAIIGSPAHPARHRCPGPACAVWNTAALSDFPWGVSPKISIPW